MSDYLLSQGTRKTPQSEAIPGTSQVPNSAGGFAWAVDEWTQLHRFLILGSEGGSYYASERDLTVKNVTSVRKCVAADGPRTVQTIVEISKGGRAPKNDASLYSLAACISLGDQNTRHLAAEALPDVARIGTHLYHFVAYAETMRGWGRTLRWAVRNWYDRKPEQLALQAVKYRQRDGWSHRDLLRLAHPANTTPEVAAIFDWIAHGTAPDGDSRRADGSALIDGFERAQASQSPAETARLVGEYKLPREALLPEHLNAPEVWDALLDADMPMTAMIRNLATMTRAGVIAPGSNGARTVIRKLTDPEQLTKARVHPIAVLIALLTYKSGRGMRGQNTWTPVVQVVDALDDAFYGSFGNVTPTGGRIMLALDVSGSMGGGEVAGVPGLTPRLASAALAMVTARTERDWECVGFFAGTGGMQAPTNRYRGYVDGITPLAISPRQRLDDVVRAVDDLPFGGTDCALPMMYAHSLKREVDTFVIYTDSETWAGSIHPAQALQKYRQDFVPHARLVVCGMVSNRFSIADPNDAGMMDVVGFDTATPEIVSSFARGEV
jgi:60 kDa SS-A/Ro ribonucleoprotein